MTEFHTVLQFSDPHLFARPDGVMRGACTYETLRATLAHARASHSPPDAILLTGDIAQDESREAYVLLRNCFADLGVPIYCLPGNHDNPQFMYEELSQPPFQYCGHFELGNWIVPMLDSHHPGDAGGQLSESELKRLAEVLAAHRNKHALIALHHHPVPSRCKWLDTVPLRNPGAMFDLVEQHPQVRCLLWGHVHQEFESRRGALLMLATPSTCRQFKPRLDEFAIDVGKPPAYRSLRLYADGSVATAVNWCEVGHEPAQL